MKFGTILGGIHDLALALRFYSRLPVPPLPGEGDPHRVPDADRLARVVPLAGAIIGMVGAAVLVIADLAGLDSRLAALLAVAALVVATGAFHEDGLADTADGLGGGRTREQKLEIMRDSRIGTYGGAALLLSLLARIEIIAGLLALGAASAAALLVAAGAVSRVAGLWLATALPPARADGAAFAAGQASTGSFAVAVGLALAIAAGSGLAGAGPVAIAAAIAAAAAVAAMMTSISRSMLGGQTGDVAGATQQLAEIAFLLAVLMIARS